MQKKLREWLDLILFLGKPEDTSEGHVYHDYKEELPPVVNLRLAGVIKILLGLGVTAVAAWKIAELLT